MARAAAIAALALVLFLGGGGSGGGDGVDAAASLSQGQSLRGNETLLSASGAFKVGFFKPAGGDHGRVYLGVMYAQAREQTVMWVANRDAPVSAASAYSATLTASGELRVMEGDRVAWRTNSSGGLANHTLTIGDDGDLVIAGSDGAGKEQVWRSFDHPTDTFVPGMEIALRQSNGSSISRTLYTSWRSDGDPATGDFTLGLDSSAQLYIWRSQDGKNSTYWRSGQWTNTNFVGIPWRSLYVYGFKFIGDPLLGGDMFLTFVPFNSSLYRFVLRPDGVETCYMLLDSGDWEVVWSQPTIPCHMYNKCGANAECAAADDGQPICTCLKGFTPKSEAEYNSGNWTQGCVRSAPLTCSGGGNVTGGDGFAVVQGVKLPDFAVWGSVAGDANACKKLCLDNCSCGAYSYSINSCLTWGQELVDVYHFPSSSGVLYELYVKCRPFVPDADSFWKSTHTGNMWDKSCFDHAGDESKVREQLMSEAASILHSVEFEIKNFETNTRANIDKPVHIIVAEKLCIGRKKIDLPLLRPGRDANKDFSGPAQSEHEKPDDGKNCELPLFAFEALATATDNFSSSNKLGEGGFGHVYKVLDRLPARTNSCLNASVISVGRLPGGEEIAVKRLSRSSGQGLEEFKNEVILIAKLQHRNLVRLLGCCIQGEEKILVYEYMPNKSLDAFLFDPERRGLLDWRTRFQIIEGVARGLLSLPRDSRLRVVHRDLKASNILLDHDMNPKISDFGMARIFGGDQNQVNTNRVVGTLGYMSPEYAMEGLFSVRSDVYSFGILILEIITGQKNSSFHHMEGSLNIVGYVSYRAHTIPSTLCAAQINADELKLLVACLQAWQLWNGDRGEQLIDPAIRGACPAKEALRCIHMALLCVQDHAHDRPDVPYVVLTLGSDASVLPMPRPPTFTLQCTSSSSGRDMYCCRDKEDGSHSSNDLTVTMLQGSWGGGDRIFFDCFLCTWRNFLLPPVSSIGSRQQVAVGDGKRRISLESRVMFMGVGGLAVEGEEAKQKTIGEEDNTHRGQGVGCVGDEHAGLADGAVPDDDTLYEPRGSHPHCY
uniref:non-specific serine/threonine protein kinase n=1 Tax=Oryza brachyantha TaxID=4533 RepID=J3MLV8_ORYBR